MIYSIATKKGLRQYQEDRAFIVNYYEKGWLAAGVFDGHGGEETAEKVRDIFLDFFGCFHDFIGTPHDVLRSVFETGVALTRGYASGSTGSVVLIKDDIATVAILGDSPVYIKNEQGITSISPEHNVRTNMFERESIISKGGYYHNGYAFAPGSYNGLQMSRAFGDASLDKILSREPYVYSEKLGPESWVAICTDGIVDPSHNGDNGKAVGRIFSALDRGAEAEELTQMAVEAETGDNVTAIVVRGF